MGWTCGFGISSARDVAKFYYDLLGPQKKILSDDLVQKMQNFTTLDSGWAKGNVDYGGGLMTINNAPVSHGRAKIGDNATYVGHAGDTYGFQSTQGFFDKLNASMSVIVNIDFDYYYPNMLMCNINQIVFKYKGITEDLKCDTNLGGEKFSCMLDSDSGLPTCRGVSHSHGMTFADCKASCSDDSLFSCHHLHSFRGDLSYCGQDQEHGVSA